MGRVSAATQRVEVDDYGNATLLQVDEETPMDGVVRELAGVATIIKTDVMGAVLRFNAAATAVLSIPSDAALELRPGKAQLAVFIKGAGVPTFAALGGSGVVLRGAPRVGLAQYDTITLIHTGDANTWAYV